MASRASGPSGSAWPRCASARCSRCSSAASSSRRSTRTWQRDSRAPFSSKDGFSVVAPTSVMVPSSTTGRKLSCWPRLKRWISSQNSSVPPPASRRRRAASHSLRKSATPLWRALIASKCRSVCRASRRAMVVLPVPGGPHRIMEESARAAIMRPSGASAARRWSCPTMSATSFGRNRSARGRAPEPANRLDAATARAYEMAAVQAGPCWTVPVPCPASSSSVKSTSPSVSAASVAPS